MPFHLESRISPTAISRWIWQRNIINCCVRGKNCDGDPGNVQTSVRRRKHGPYTESPNLPRSEKATQLKSKVNSILIILFDKGTVSKEFVLEGQTVDSAYYWDVLRRLRENMWRLRPELRRQKNWLLHDNGPYHTSFLSPGSFFTKNNMIVDPGHLTFLCFAPEERPRFHPRSCGICGGRSGTGAGFLRVRGFPLPIRITPTAKH
jgi:hypothetical protein